MELTEFETLAALVDDYGAARQLHAKSLAAAREITAAVRSRLESERTAQAERKAQLDAILSDDGRGQSSRRLAQLELDRVEAPKIDESERDAFSEEIQVAKTALGEIHNLEARLKDSFAACEAVLKAARKESVSASVDVTLLERHIEGTEQEFTLLEREVK